MEEVSKVCDIGAHEQCSMKNCLCVCHTVTASKILKARELLDRDAKDKINNIFEPFIEHVKNLTIYGISITEFLDIDIAKVSKMFTIDPAFFKNDNDSVEGREEGKEETFKEQTTRKMRELGGSWTQRQRDEDDDDYPTLINYLYHTMKGQDDA